MNRVCVCHLSFCLYIRDRHVHFPNFTQIYGVTKTAFLTLIFLKRHTTEAVSKSELHFPGEGLSVIHSETTHPKNYAIKVTECFGLRFHKMIIS